MALCITSLKMFLSFVLEISTSEESSLVLGLAEQLCVAGGSVVQVRKLDEERALC